MSTERRPVALTYLITFTRYGTRLHGDETGSVDREHNFPGNRYLDPNPLRQRFEKRRMDQAAYALDTQRREIVLGAVQEVCRHRNWHLLAAHVRTNHVHVVLEAMQEPEKILNTLKSYASRDLNKAGLDQAQRRWTRYGSTRYLWKPKEIVAAIEYVVRGQGAAMAVYDESTSRGATVRER